MNTTTDKPRSDSILYGLTAEQQARVKQWLFDENLPFAKVAELCASELKVAVGKTSVVRYFRRELSVRRLEARMKRSGGENGARSVDDCYRDLMAEAGELALESVRGELDEQKTRAFVQCTRLVLAGRREGNQSRRAALAEEKFEFDIATACLMKQMEIQGIVEDDSLSDEERIRAVREELFGPDLPE
jgi:hypothetical protein